MYAETQGSMQDDYEIHKKSFGIKFDATGRQNCDPLSV